MIVHPRSFRVDTQKISLNKSNSNGQTSKRSKVFESINKNVTNNRSALNDRLLCSAVLAYPFIFVFRSTRLSIHFCVPQYSPIHSFLCSQFYRLFKTSKSKCKLKGILANVLP